MRSASHRTIPFVAQPGDPFPVAELLARTPWLHGECLSVERARLLPAAPLPSAPPPPAPLPSESSARPRFRVRALGEDVADVARLLRAWSRALPAGPAAGPVPLALVVNAGETARHTAWRLLEAERRRRESGDRSRAMRNTTLVTARNERAVSWLAAKMIVAALRPESGAEPVRYRMLIPAEDEVRWETVTAHGSCETQSSRGAQGRAEAARGCEVLITATHGFDACADGGDGFVLCGRDAQQEVAAAGGRGMLACGRGFACPRGPHPVELRHFRTELLVLNSCNGLRPGAGLLNAEFNLGLSFLDGVGAGYCGTPYSSSGGELAAAVLGATLAAGTPFARAVSEANGALMDAALEGPSLVAIGDPAHRRPLSDCGVVEAPLGCDGGSVDAGAAWLLALDVRDPGRAAAADRGDLAWAIESDAARRRPPYWTQARLDDERMLLRIYGFPEPLGRLHVRPVAKSALAARVDEACGALQRWSELRRQVDADAAGDAAAILAMSESIRSAANGLFLRLRFDGGAAARLQRLVGTAVQAAEAARDTVLDALLPALAGPAWLTNLQASNYHPQRVDAAACHLCGEPAVRKALSHPATGYERDVLICSLCGIVEDRAHRGGASLRISAQDEVRPGAAFEVEVELRTEAGKGRAGEFVVAPRLSVIGQAHLLPEPAAARSGGGCHRFTFRLPDTLPPHRYFIKAIAASAEEIAFASRPFFLV